LSRITTLISNEKESARLNKGTHNELNCQKELNKDVQDNSEFNYAV